MKLNDCPGDSLFSFLLHRIFVAIQANKRVFNTPLARLNEHIIDMHQALYASQLQQRNQYTIVCFAIVLAAQLDELS